MFLILQVGRSGPDGNEGREKTAFKWKEGECLSALASSLTSKDKLRPRKQDLTLRRPRKVLMASNVFSNDVWGFRNLPPHNLVEQERETKLCGADTVGLHFGELLLSRGIIKTSS